MGETGEPMRLLLIEDNQRLADYLTTALLNGGFAVDHVSTTVDADGALATMHYDTLLLDLGLPDMDGLVWLAQQRRRQMTRPVLVLTARDSLEDLVAGLNQGADDYLRKPFELDELIARVRALLRRPGEALGVTLKAGNMTFDTSSREVAVDGIPVEFGRREMDGLELLMRRLGRVVPKAAIEDAIYSFGEDLASNAIEVLVHRIRKRLQEAGADLHIHTLRGVGYVLSDKASGAP
jgi:DNA-binding response OmpR family regulator